MCKTVCASGDCVYPIGGICKQGVFFYFNLFLTLLYSALWDDASGVVTSFGGTRAVERIEGLSMGDATRQWYTVVGCVLCADGPCGHGVWQGSFHWPLAW